MLMLETIPKTANSNEMRWKEKHFGKISQCKRCQPMAIGLKHSQTY